MSLPGSGTTTRTSSVERTGGAFAHAHLQIETMASRRQWRLRHENPFAPTIGDGFAKRPLAIPQDHRGSRLRPAGDDGIALRVDADDVEAGQRRRGQWRRRLWQRRHTRRRSGSLPFLCLAWLEQVDADRHCHRKQARSGDYGRPHEPTIGIGMDGPHIHSRKPNTITMEVQRYRRAQRPRSRAWAGSGGTVDQRSQLRDPALDTHRPAFDERRRPRR